MSTQDQPYTHKDVSSDPTLPLLVKASDEDLVQELTNLGCLLTQVTSKSYFEISPPSKTTVNFKVTSNLSRIQKYQTETRYFEASGGEIPGKVVAILHADLKVVKSIDYPTNKTVGLSLTQLAMKAKQSE